MVELHDERNLVGVLAGHRTQHAEGGRDRVASAFQRQFRDVRWIEVGRVGRERGARRVLDTLINREDRQVAGVCQSAGPEHRIQAGQDPGRAVRRRHTAVDKIGTGQVQARGINGLTVMVEQCGVIAQHRDNSLQPGHTQACRHSVASAPLSN